MFSRPHHQRIETLLQGLDASFLADCGCYFAGGTAIALQLGEFRRSDDIDFVCASADGYRRLRESVFSKGFDALAKRTLPLLRPIRADQYGVRCVLGDAQAPVKFEIVREARIALAPGKDRIGGVLLLSREDLFAEKLLANTDRGLDRSTLHRDLIDLLVMQMHWGPIPEAAWRKAREAYGESVDKALGQVTESLRQPARLRECLDAMDCDAATRPALEAQLLGNS